jgi:Ca2+-binding EF-hand superfamily protein
MFKRGNTLPLLLLAAVLFGIGANLKSSFAQKACVPKQRDKLALGEEDVKRLMLLIGPNENGKITKQEWMKFMESEFDRLDKDKSGELDAKELSRSRLTVSPFTKVGK